MADAAGSPDDRGDRGHYSGGGGDGRGYDSPARGERGGGRGGRGGGRGGGRSRAGRENSLHVRGYDRRDITADDIRQAFDKFGPVLDVYMPRDFHTKELRGFCYVEFEDRGDAESALQRLDGSDELRAGQHGLQVAWAAGERKTSDQMRTREADFDRGDRPPAGSGYPDDRRRDRSDYPEQRHGYRDRDPDSSRYDDQGRYRDRGRDRDGYGGRGGRNSDRDRGGNGAYRSERPYRGDPPPRGDGYGRPDPPRSTLYGGGRGGRSAPSRRDDYEPRGGADRQRNDYDNYDSYDNYDNRRSSRKRSPSRSLSPERGRGTAGRYSPRRRTSPPRDQARSPPPSSPGGPGPIDDGGGGGWDDAPPSDS